MEGGLSLSNQYPSEGKSKYVSPLRLHNRWDWKDVAQLFVLQHSHRWKWKSKSRLENSTQTTCKLNEVWYDSAALVCVLRCRATCHVLMIKPSFLSIILGLFLNSQPKPPSLFPLITTDYVFAINLPQENITASFLLWHLDKASVGPTCKSLLHLPLTAPSVTTPWNWDCYYAGVWE